MRLGEVVEPVQFPFTVGARGWYPTSSYPCGDGGQSESEDVSRVHWSDLYVWCGAESGAGVSGRGELIVSPRVLARVAHVHVQ